MVTRNIIRAILLILLFTQSASAADFVESSKKITKADVVPATVIFATNDLMMLLGGRVRNEYFGLGRAQTLSKDSSMFDNQSIARLKASWLVGVQQGRKKYDEPAIEAGVKLTHYSYWQNQSRYVPLNEEALTIRSLDNAQIGDHTHRNLMPLVFMEDAFFKICIHPFITCFKSIPTYIQAGMFPYALGRGLSLGAYSAGGIPHMGWRLDGGAGSSEQSPVGLVIHTDLTKKLAIEAYYTKFLEQSSSITETRSPTRLSRMYGVRPERGIDKDAEAWSLKFDYTDEGNKWGDLHIQPYVLYARNPDQQIELPSDASTKLWTYGTMLEYKYHGFSLNIEAAGNIGTQKVHAIDRNQVILKRNKSNGQVQEVFSHVYVSLGNETVRARVVDAGNPNPFPSVAGLIPLIPANPNYYPPTAASGGNKFALQNVTSCDGKLLKDASGVDYQINSADVASLTAENMPVMDVPGNRLTPRTAPSNDLLDLVNTDLNRRTDMNGKQLFQGDGRLVTVDLPVVLSDQIAQLLAPPLPPTDAPSANASRARFIDNLQYGRSVVNSNLLGNKRFRKGYKLNLRGMMMLCDAAYTFEKYPFKIAATAQWIGGDSYPYNTECNKTYKGFMTLRDYNYVGQEVPLFALLYARVIPRPLNISYNKMYAFNDFDHASNLRILGAGFTWFPVKDDPQKSRVMFNVASVWNDASLKKWDTTACPRFDALTNFAIAGGSIGTTKVPGVRDELGFTGWETCQKASHHLGVEINWYMEYHFFSNCKIYSINGIFIPGQLYKDLKGQPNRNARRVDITPGREGKAIYGSLGHDIAYGFHAGLRFSF